MKLYAGIDLHSNNSMIVIIDEQDRVVLQDRFSNALQQILLALASFKQRLLGSYLRAQHLQNLAIAVRLERFHRFGPPHPENAFDFLYQAGFEHPPAARIQAVVQTHLNLRAFPARWPFSWQDIMRREISWRRSRSPPRTSAVPQPR